MSSVPRIDRTALPPAIAVAPCAALLLPPDDAPALLNAAAARLLAELDEASIDHAGRLDAEHPFAAALRKAAATARAGATATVRLAHQRLEVVIAEQDAAGRIVWLQPAPAGPAAAPLPAELVSDVLTRLEFATNAIEVGVWERDLRTDQARWSAAMARVLGYAGDAAPRTAADVDALIHPDDLPAVLRAREERARTGATVNMEYRWRLPDGSWRWIHSRSRLIDRDGQRPRLVGVLQDITWRKQAESQLRALAGRLSLMGQLGRIGQFERNLVTGEGQWDPVCCELFGVDPQQGAPPIAQALERIDPRDRDRLAAVIDAHRTQPAGTEFAVDYRVLLPDGTWRHVDVRGRTERNALDQPVIVAAVVDISAQQAAIDHLRASAHTVQLATEATGLALWERDLQTQVQTWSAAMRALFGFAPDDPVTVDTWLAAVHPADRALARAAYQRRSSGDTGQFEYRIVRRDGKVRYLVSRAVVERDADGALRRLVGVTWDDTARWEMQRQAHRLAETLQMATNAAQLGVWEVDLVTRRTQWNAQMYQIHGLDPGAEPLPYKAWLETVVPEDRARAHANSRALFAQGCDYADDFRIHRGDGSVAYIRASARAEVVDGAVQRVVGTYQDLTTLYERAEAEQQLRQRLQLATETARLGVWVTDWASGRTEWDAQVCRILGVGDAPREGSLDAFVALLHPDDREACTAEYLRHVLDPRCERGFVRARIVRPDGVVRHLDMPFRVERDAEGKPVRVVGVDHDVTELREVEAQLRAANRKFDTAAAVTGLGVFDCDVERGMALWDARQSALYGFEATEHEISNEAWLQLLVPEDRAPAWQRIAQALERPGKHVLEYRIRRHDGAVRHMQVSLDIEFKEGRAWRAIGTSLDVTDLRDAEFAARATNARLALANETGRIGVFERDVADRLVYVDAGWRALFGLHRDPLPTVDSSLGQVAESDRAAVRAARERCRQTDEPVRCDYRYILPSGEQRSFTSWRRRRLDAQGQYAGELGVVIDITEQRAAEQAARDAAERLGLAQRAARMGVWEWNLVTNVLTWDEQMNALFGRDAPIESYEQFKLLVHPDDLGPLEARIQRTIDNGEPFDGEFRIVLADGRMRVIGGRGEVHYDEQHRPVGMIGVNWDVTEQRATERAAQDAAERLALAQRGAGMGVWQWDCVTGQIEWDEQVRRNFGVGPDTDVTYAMFRAQIHPDDLERVESELSAAVERREPFSTEFRIRRRDGEERVIGSRGKVYYDASGRALRMIGIDWDATAARATERAVIEASRRLALATQGVGIGVWERSDDGEDMEWDDQMYRLFGCAPGDGRPLQIWRARVHPEDRAAVSRIAATAGDGGTYESLFRVQLPDGSERWIASRGMRRAHPTRPLIGINWDVTESRRIEDALRAKETAERANLAKSEFLSRMSHELRTPLNAIIGFTQLLELDPADPPRPTQAERLALIRNSGWHLLSLINDVLDLSRIESGRTSVSMEVVAWRAVVDETMSMIAPEAAPAAISLGLHVAGDVPPTLWADRTRLRQVLLNLLSNAVKYNRPRGTVTVEVTADAEGAVTLAVRDTGPGLSPAQLARVFEPFNRLGRETSESHGTGIGLAISQRLVQQMEGSIAVESTLGVGSTFRVTLRRACTEDRPPAPAAPAAQAGVALREDVRGTVLYIEDNPANSLLVEQFLQFRPQVKLYQAADGATGLVMAAVCQPDLILIDIRLPDMTGDEVLRQLQQQPETARIACIAVSANAMPHDVEQALRAGFEHYWTKPLDARRFLEGVDSVLGSARARSAR
jgi:PAS domain S-box-containing protein